jgi:anthranilate synthase component 2
VTTLIIDNYDSFTWNLFQLFGSLGGAPRVTRNDAITLDEIRAVAPERIVLSPGPGRPDDRRRIGVSAEILRLLVTVPILGVCLGHQAIACAFGGRVVRATPRHGKTSPVEHDGRAIFRDLPTTFEAMRYHSLAVDPSSLPPDLRVTAWCKDGTVMGVRHTRYPIFGVQFHPESIGTAVGPAICRSFLRGEFE